MQLFDVNACRLEKAGFMAIGFFDSLHMGHKSVIERAVSLAKQNGTVSSVFLFKNNIYDLIGVNKAPIFSFESRLREIERIGVNKVFYIEADKAFLSLSPEAFIAFLRRKLSIDGTVCGSDFTFGCKGKGNAEDLLREFPRGEIVDLCYQSGEKVSTSLVKELLLKGDIATANKLLGRPFIICETVVAGRAEGKKNGFPTINMPFKSGVLKSGVYLSETIINNVPYMSLTNIGGHPTYHDDKENAETFILDYNGSLYGQSPEVLLLDYLREIKKFDTVDSLVQQIESDVEKRREYDTIRTIGDR